MILTPEIIFKKFAERLSSKTKKADLEYLVCANRQIEKWLQAELFLSFQKVAFPVIYDRDDKEIDSSGEWICDIATEDEIIDSNSANKIRVDVCIAENPLLHKYINKRNWQIRDTGKIQECRKLYERQKFYYVELKDIHWNGRDINRAADLLVNDLKKFHDLDWRSFPSYLPKSVISIGCIAFLDPDDAKSSIPKIKHKALLKANKLFASKGIFKSARINNYIYLLMIYHEVH